ncbi:hypothetical protein GGR56DRAFT_586084 [Xylariaceae sp. FL0804]|nr:hypothetical protein GGR56DRAFT_586084 [Xylariaceae sp. FL0804]
MLLLALRLRTHRRWHRARATARRQSTSGYTPRAGAACCLFEARPGSAAESCHPVTAACCSQTSYRTPRYCAEQHWCVSSLLPSFSFFSLSLSLLIHSQFFPSSTFLTSIPDDLNAKCFVSSVCRRHGFLGGSLPDIFESKGMSHPTIQPEKDRRTSG